MAFRRKWTDTRKFNGKKYMFHTATSSKLVGKITAEAIRGLGGQARLTSRVVSVNDPSGPEQGFRKGQVSWETWIRNVALNPSTTKVVVRELRAAGFDV